MPRNDKVCLDDLTHTIEWLCNEIQTQTSTERTRVQKENREVMAKYCQGDISVSDLLSQLKKEPVNIKTKCFRHMARKFVKREGYTKQRPNTSGSYLNYHDEKMKEQLGCK